MMEHLLADAAGAPPQDASRDLDAPLPVPDAAAPPGDDGGQDAATFADATTSADSSANPIEPPDVAPTADQPTPLPTSVATPRVHDAMRVLSRMQIDLDLATEGKRAATYDEVDDAFDNAIKALGIRLPSARAADEAGIRATTAISPPMTG